MLSTRAQIAFGFIVLVVFVSAVRGQGPARAGHAEWSPILDPAEYRFVLVGDSQTTTPYANRINSHMRSWPVRFAGELITAPSAGVGHLVTVGNGGGGSGSYEFVDPNVGWGDGGPSDFFNMGGHRWLLDGDVPDGSSALAHFGIRFEGAELDAHWSKRWDIGVDLVARIAVRTGPNSVSAVETRAVRGGVESSVFSTTFEIEQEWGITILEQRIPASINRDADEPGVAIYLPDGVEESAGQSLCVIGVALLAVDSEGDLLPGMVCAPTGRGGWAGGDHLAKQSQQSRAALIRMVDAEHLMVMLGHNNEDSGMNQFAPNLVSLLGLWTEAFHSEDRALRSCTLVSPWAFGSQAQVSRLAFVDSVMEETARSLRIAWSWSFFDLYRGYTPSAMDPDRYGIVATLHPAQIRIARAMSEDLFCGLFPHLASDCWLPAPDPSDRIRGERLFTERP